MAKYDEYYLDKNYFGSPYTGLMDYFQNAERGTLVDLGAGQGRDSLPLAKIGYHVTAVDASRIGIEQIKEADNTIISVVDDLYTFNVASFDYILMDSILHFYKCDMKNELNLVKRILTEMQPGAVFVNCLLKSKRAEKVLKDIVIEFPVAVQHEGYVDYPDFNAVYHMLVVRKENG